MTERRPIYPTASRIPHRMKRISVVRQTGVKMSVDRLTHFEMVSFEYVSAFQRFSARASRRFAEFTEKH